MFTCDKMFLRQLEWSLKVIALKIMEQLHNNIYQPQNNAYWDFENCLSHLRAWDSFISKVIRHLYFWKPHKATIYLRLILKYFCVNLAPWFSLAWRNNSYLFGKVTRVAFKVRKVIFSLCSFKTCGQKPFHVLTVHRGWLLLSFMPQTKLAITVPTSTFSWSETLHHFSVMSLSPRLPLLRFTNQWKKQEQLTACSCSNSSYTLQRTKRENSRCQGEYYNGKSYNC